MSSRPNIEDVSKIRELLHKRRALELEITELRRAEERLGEADQEKYQIEIAILKQVEAMDCAVGGLWVGATLHLVSQPA